MRSPTTEQLIRPIEEQLQRGGGKAPLASHADWTHPLYPLWVELHLDDVTGLAGAWTSVAMRAECAKCLGPLHDGPYPPFTMCDECQLCFEVRDGHFALDTLERAMDRGPDA